MKRIALALLVAVSSTACAGTLTEPFNNLKDQPVYAFRLQPFEPPAPAAGAPAGLPIPIPPQLQQWLSAGAQYLPPGLLPPGLLPGGTPTPAPSNAPRFHNYVIIAQALVSDKKVHDDIVDLLGHESNWEVPRVSCQQYTPEFAFAVGMPPGSSGGPVAAPTAGAVPAEVLVSLSCEQVQMFNYTWPYGQKTGITADSAKRIYAIIQNAFGR
jgi:hypothetical protein